MGRKCDNKEGDLNWAHPFPRNSYYKKGSDITKGVITDVRVYYSELHNATSIYWECKILPSKVIYVWTTYWTFISANLTSYSIQNSGIPVFGVFFLKFIVLSLVL